MKLIQPNCRIQFTAQDIAFITNVLGGKEGDAVNITQLLTDEESRDLILDNDALFHAVLEQRCCLEISNHFYFYIIVRHLLKRNGIADCKTADYVAELMAEYSQTSNTQFKLPGQTQSLDYFFDMLKALQTVDDRTGFYIRAHIGNHSLFLSGLFPQRIRSRAENKGFPDMSYYEAVGRTNFLVASDHRLAQKYHVADVYATLGDRFQTVRRTLNDLSERLVSLGDSDNSVEGFLKSSFGM